MSRTRTGEGGRDSFCSFVATLAASSGASYSLGVTLTSAPRRDPVLSASTPLTQVRSQARILGIPRTRQGGLAAFPRENGVRDPQFVGYIVTSSGRRL